MKIHLYSYNAQNSYANTQSFLETHRLERNTLIFIQEPFYGHIRTHKNTNSNTGLPIIGPTLHPNYICLFEEHVSPYPRVLAYAHRSLTILSPAIHVLNHPSPYVQVVSLALSTRATRYFYNIYNSQRLEALITLENEDALPPAHVVLGDFNLHCVNWDTKSTPSPKHLIHRLHDMMTNLNVSLASTPNVCTWFPQSDDNK